MRRKLIKSDKLANTAIVATGTVEWILDARDLEEYAITLAGKVVSATGHREVKIEAYEGFGDDIDSAEFATTATTVVATWNTSPGNTDGLYVVDVSVQVCDWIKIKFTGLTNSAATLTDFMMRAR